MNIILLLSDTFRYDNLFSRASMPIRTPNLEAFARRAVSASGMYVSSFPTIPNRTDLTTGRCGWPTYGWQERPKSSQNHMPAILGKAGYVSQLLCDCPHLFNARFDAGFSAATVIRGQEGDTAFLRMNHPIQHVMPPEKTRPSKHFAGQNLADISSWMNVHWHNEEDRFAPRTAKLAVEWLEENYQHDPFLLWVDFFDPHEPWNPPEYMVKRYDSQYDGPPMIHPNYGKASDYTPAELRNLRAHYCAEAELVDRWIGRVIQKIDDVGLWDNSIVVFTTDHGIFLGEHNSTGKSNISPSDERCWPLYPEIAHIPFMIAAPGLAGGREIDALVQPMDILPTLIDLAGVTAEPAEPFHGRSFAPLLRGQTQEPVHEFVVSGQFLSKTTTRHNTPVLYTAQWAYAPVGQDGRRELYDIKADPSATQNVAADNPKVVEHLHKLLLDWLTQMNPATAMIGLINPAKE